MTLLQAILLGGIYYLNVYHPGQGSNTIVFAPLCVVLLVGLVLGDVPTAMKVGATIQPLYLAFSSAGGTIAQDKCAAGLVPAAVVLTTGMSMDMAIALSVTVSIVLAQLHTVRRIVAATWVHMADRYAEEGNIRGIMLCNFLYNSLAKVVIFWVPMTMMLYFGADFIGNVMSNLPLWLERGLSVTGKMMPALGYAMTIQMIGRRELIPYFIGGFFFAKYSGLATMPLACTALFIAFLDMRFSSRMQTSGTSADSLLSSFRGKNAQEASDQRVLSKRDITKAWLRWWWGIEQCNSFERLQAVGFCCTIAPILKKLYPNDKQALVEGLKRHMTFFNTQGIWGAVIPGIVISLEEQRAMGAPIADSAIIGIKTGLMGPMAGIGDTIDWSTVRPLLLAFFVPYGLEGHWWAAVLPWLIQFAMTQAEGYSFIHMGYRLGTQAATSLLQSGQIQQVITFFGVMGLFMMGGLSASLVDLQIGLVIPTSGTPMNVQTDILDKILPGLLSILLIFGIYGYLRKKGNMLKAVFWILGLGLLGGSLGIFA